MLTGNGSACAFLGNESLELLRCLPRCERLANIVAGIAIRLAAVRHQTCILTHHLLDTSDPILLEVLRLIAKAFELDLKVGVNLFELPVSGPVLFLRLGFGPNGGVVLLFRLFDVALLDDGDLRIEALDGQAIGLVALLFLLARTNMIDAWALRGGGRLTSIISCSFVCLSLCNFEIAVWCCINKSQFRSLSGDQEPTGRLLVSLDASKSFSLASNEPAMVALSLSLASAAAKVSCLKAVSAVFKWPVSLLPSEVLASFLSFAAYSRSTIDVCLFSLDLFASLQGTDWKLCRNGQLTLQNAK